MKRGIALRAGFFSVALLVSTTGRLLYSQEADREGGGPAARAAAFRATRADAQGVFHEDYLARAWASWTALGSGKVFVSADLGWRQMGPFGLFGPTANSYAGVGQLAAGRVTSIAIHPRDGSTMYAGSASGGIWKTTNGGASWAPISDDGPCYSSAIGAIAIDPSAPSSVFVGTGEINTRDYVGCGVISSTNGQAPWSTSQSSQSNFFGRIIVDSSSAGRANATVLLAAGSAGVSRSTDSGRSWQQVLPRGDFSYSSSVVAAPGRPGVFFSALGDYSGRGKFSGVYRSTSFGEFWTPLAPLPGVLPNQSRIELATSADLVYALVADRDSRLVTGLYRWNEKQPQLGWTKLPATGLVTVYDRLLYPDFMGNQSEYGLVLSVDPTDAKRVWAAGVGAFVSSDSGKTFERAAREVHVDWHAIEFDPSDPTHMVAGTDGGVYVSYDRGRSWRSQSYGMVTAQFYAGISVAPSGFEIFGGLQDNNSVQFRGSPVWDALVAVGDGGYTAIDPRAPNNPYVASAVNTGIYRYGEGVGGIPIPSKNGRSGDDELMALAPPLVVDSSSNPGTLYYGVRNLYRSRDQGQNWTALDPISPTGGTFTTIALAPPPSLRMYAGTSDGWVFASTDRGDHWTRPQVRTVTGKITKIAVDPLDPKHILVASSTDRAKPLFESSDGGGTFSDQIGRNINFPVYSVLFVPQPRLVMIGSDFGVKATTNGVDWGYVGVPQLPLTPVTDLVYVPKTNSVVAATYGRGVWSYALGLFPGGADFNRGDVNRDGRVFADDAQLVQNAITGGVSDPSKGLVYPLGDANCDGTLDSRDVLIILNFSVGNNLSPTCVGIKIAAAATQATSNRARLPA